MEYEGITQEIIGSAYQAYSQSTAKNYPKDPVNPVEYNKMEYEDITHKIIGAAYKVYKELGFGFLEIVYKKAMIIELSKDDLKVEAEKPLKVYYDNQVVGDFFADLFVEDAVIARPPRLSEQFN